MVDVERLRQIGWENPEEAMRWYDAGWDDLEEALRWREAGWGRQLSAEEFRNLVRYNSYIPKEKTEDHLLTEIIDACLLRYEVGWKDPAEAYKWYLVEAVAPQDALTLHNAGWDVEKALEWLGAHYDRADMIGGFWLERPQEALRWKEAGWKNATEAYEWIQAGWKDPEEAMKWKKVWGEWREVLNEVYPPESGLKPSEALVVTVGVMAGSPERLYLIKESGWSDPHEAYEWYAGDWDDPYRAYEWHEVESILNERWEDKGEAYRWYIAGWDDPGEALAWRSAGWTGAEEALSWYQAGWEDPVEARDWYDAGWNDGEEALKWHRAGWDNPERAFEWLEEGWENPEEAMRWSSLWDSPEEALKWKEAGFEDPELAEAWRVAGWENPEEAFEWYEAGWKWAPEVAKKLSKAVGEVSGKAVDKIVEAIDYLLASEMESPVRSVRKGRLLSP